MGFRSNVKFYPATALSVHAQNSVSSVSPTLKNKEKAARWLSHLIASFLVSSNVIYISRSNFLPSMVCSAG